MKVKLEYGNRVRTTEVDKTEIVETDDFFQLYCSLKKEYIVEHNLDVTDGSAVEYLNDFSEFEDHPGEGAFYIGFEEGEYIEGWILI